MDKPQKLLFDLVIGIRPRLTSYLEADTVLMLKLNTEHISKTNNTEVFISPGFMWTIRNIAIKSGLQIPIYRNLKNNKSKYRAKTLLEWHL
ncbi:MAG: hypothetical protein COB17_08210 [Sulfurimonas sp.]|nr:MAG: hypothetical protein COB17_08210 [Sulfurimonas sp.]